MILSMYDLMLQCLPHETINQNFGGSIPVGEINLPQPRTAVSLNN